MWAISSGVSEEVKTFFIFDYSGDSVVAFIGGGVGGAATLFFSAANLL